MKLAGTLIGHRWGGDVLHVRCGMCAGGVACHRRVSRLATCLITMLMALPFTTSSDAAYLASVGPAPLRFQESVDVKPKIVLSSLPQDAPETNFCIPEAVAITNEAPPLVVTPTVTMIAQPAPVPEPAPTVSSTNEVVVTPQITPQMVVEFFRSHSGSNGNRDPAVVVPYNFTPPVPPTKPTSSATYEVP
jgi:hypothetical protein